MDCQCTRWPLDCAAFNAHHHGLSHATRRCAGTAAGPVEAYVERAIQLGLREMGFSDHNPLPHGFGANVRMKESELDYYVNRILELRFNYRGRIDVLLGLEMDFVEGLESYPKTNRRVSVGLHHRAHRLSRPRVPHRLLGKFRPTTLTRTTRGTLTCCENSAAAGCATSLRISMWRNAPASADGTFRA